MSKIIYSIDSRGNCYLDVIKGYFSLSDERMFQEINNLHDVLIDQLERKGIDYVKLKPALVPNKKKREIVIVFDTSQIQSLCYGADIFNRIISLLDKNSVNSFLAGDYLNLLNISNGGELFIQLLQSHIDLSKLKCQSAEQLFFVYVNNISDKLNRDLFNGLQSYPDFVDIIDVTFSSPFKIYISSILPPIFLKYRDVIILGTVEYGDDRDVNEYGYDFEKYGFAVKNITTELFGTYLSYKIERRYFNYTDRSDQMMSLNAILPIFNDLKKANINVSEEKLNYLRTNKIDTMDRVGLMDLSKDQFERMIKDNIDSNYIFCMEFKEDYNIAKFNIMLEFIWNNHSYKILVGLKYDHEHNEISLLTMF